MRYLPVIVTTGALLSGLAAGFLSGKSLAEFNGAEESQSSSKAPAVGAAIKKSLSSGHLGAGIEKKPEVTSLPVRGISWERKLLSTSVSEYPELFEKERREALTSDRLFRLLALWGERDPAGFIAWGRKQPSYLHMEEAGHGISVEFSIMEAAIQQGLDKAWELAAKLPGTPDEHRWNLLTSVLKRDPATGVKLLQEHRDTFSASSQAYGAWFNIDPMKSLPLLEEFTPGKARSDLVRESARYYEDNPGESAAAEAWFQKLPPDLQAVVAKKAEDGQFYQVSPEHLATLRRIWKVESPPAEEQ